MPHSARPTKLDGYSLLPMMKPSAAAPTAETGSAAAAEMGSAAAETGNAAALDPRPNFIVSQFHGDDIAMSWFIIVKQYNASATMKLIVWGTGTEVSSEQ